MIISIEGELMLEEFEGGFAPCAMRINNDTLDMIVANRTGIASEGNRGFALKEDIVYLGRAKITIELLDRDRSGE